MGPRDLAGQEADILLVHHTRMHDCESLLCADALFPVAGMQVGQDACQPFSCHHVDLAAHDYP